MTVRRTVGELVVVHCLLSRRTQDHVRATPRTGPRTPTLEELLLQLGLGNLNLNGLVNLLLVPALVVGVVLDGGGKERVDKGRLAQARLASNLERRSACTSTRHAVKQPTMMVKPAPRFATILCRWLGRLAMPIGEALSVAGAIFNNVLTKRIL